MNFVQKHAIVKAKAMALNIPESDAYRLCVVEYETGHTLNTYNQNVENAYNVYMTEGTRPGTAEDLAHKKKIEEELIVSKVEAIKRAWRLELAAQASVKERIDIKHGEGTFRTATRSLEEYEEAQRWKIPKIGMPDFGGIGDIKKGAQTTAIVLMVFVALIIYLMFVKGKGAEGVTVAV